MPAKKVKIEKIKDDISALAEDLKEILKVAKEKYDNLDEGQKKKIKNAVAGATALIGGAVMRKMIKRKKNNKE